MSSSDDEAEALPITVSNYHFGDDEDEPISFHVLPIQWSDGERQGGKKVRIFLYGTADNGLQKIYKHVIAWRFDLSNVDPEVSVLSKENCWLKLQKPRKSFEDMVRSIFVTVQCLHYAKRNPEASYKSLQVHLSKVFSLYDVRRSQNYLAEHRSLIRDSIKRNGVLARCKLLANFLEEKPTKRKLSDEDIQATKNLRFVVDDIEDDMVDDAENESNDIDSLFSSVCAFCDDGGELLCCEGRCLRSFHPTVETALGSDCKSLGLTKDEVDATPTFFCKNCKYKQHQCFACGKLGSSDNSTGAEVVPCVSAICGRFYHPCCVSKLLDRDTGVSAEELEKKISMGEPFTCPIHKCRACKQGENRNDRELQFAVCLRCPKSYHRKCLPREIGFEMGEGSHGEGRLIARAWEGLLPNRILIYCTKHDINEYGRTIFRDHLKFPDVEVKKIKRKQTSEFLVERDKVMSKKRTLPLEDLQRVRTAPALSTQKQKPFYAKVGDRKVFSGFDTSRNATTNTTSKKELKTSISKSIGDGVRQKSLSRGKNWGNDTFGKLQHGEKEKNRRGMDEISSVNKTDGGKLSANEMCNEMLPPSERGDNDNRNSEPSKPGTQFVAARSRIRVNLPDNTASRCITDSNEPGSGNRAINLEHLMECMKDGSYQPHCNEMDEILTGETDIGNTSAMELYASDLPTLSRHSYDPTELRSGHPCNPLGFALGPHLKYSLHNTAGWVDE